MDRQINISVTMQVLDPEWDEFVSTLSCVHHVQTSLWGQVKAAMGYRFMRIIARENGRIVGGGQLLIRHIAPFLSMAFMPKGPLLSICDPVLAKAIIDELLLLAQKHHFLLLAVQPTNYDLEFKEIFAVRGFTPSWLELASTATILIDLTLETDQIQAQMKRQTRQNIRRSEREGITIREGNEDDLAGFYQFHISTSQRQGFTPYSEEYYKRMWQILRPHSYIQLIIAEFEGKPISALLLIPFGDTVVAKILGWSGEHSECRPNDAVFWASILWAKSHGFHYFDLEGIERKCATDSLQGNPIREDMKSSYTFFKLGYGGIVTLYPEAYDYVFNPVLRWTYRKIFSNSERGSKIYRWLDQIRRRYG